MILREGGNVFKDQDGNSLTQSIDQSQVPATVHFLEQITGLEFPRDRWLGSTGRVATSGDLDLAVDLDQVSKDDLTARLTAWANESKLNPEEWVKKKGEVHFRSPIAGRPQNGFVQVDFIFLHNLDWGTFYYAGGENSSYRGMHRNVLLSSLAKFHGLKVGTNGMISRTTNRLIDGGQDPDSAASVLLGPGHDRNSIKNVETIYSSLRSDPDRDAKLQDFRGFLGREGLQEPVLKENDVNFLARLRDRIVNQGMLALVEHNLGSEPVIEAATAPVGGRAKGIEHLEDWVFRDGSRGVRTALSIADHLAQDASAATVKWDGRPAVIFGRKPSTGEFVLTDGSGFEAKTYDGLATSPDMMAQIQSNRDGDRSGLIDIYRLLWSMLEQSLPTNFRGYVKGDLLYTQTPPLVAGNYVFQPNTVEYRIPAKSSLGQKIDNSTVGIAMHSMYADQGDPKQPLSRVRFNPAPGLLLVDPIVAKPVQLNQDLVREIKQVLRSQGKHVDLLFNPLELRSQQITNLAKLCIDYINFRVGTGNFDSLLAGFGEWLKTKVTARKFNNIIEYLRSPSSNTEGMAAAFAMFLLLHDLKLDLKRQLDLQVPGNEGWVLATPAGYAKVVDRFDFTARNRARNNP
jgi:hypothetical protein